MPYNDKEYAILVAAGMGLTGRKAIEYIKQYFKREIPEATYWRYYSRIQTSTFTELEYQTVHKVQTHIERINYFKHLRKIGLSSLEDIEDPFKKISGALKLAELEKYIAQLESMSVQYYEKALQDNRLELKQLAV